MWLPGSKSLSNRVLLLASLSRGETKIENVLESDDTKYMLAALRQLKVRVAKQTGKSTLTFLDRWISFPIWKGKK